MSYIRRNSLQVLPQEALERLRCSRKTPPGGALDRLRPSCAPLRCLCRSCEIPPGGALERLRRFRARDCIALGRHLQEGCSSDCVPLARTTALLAAPPCPRLRRKAPRHLWFRTDPTTAVSAQATALLSRDAIATTLTFTCSKNEEQRVSLLFKTTIN